MQDNNQKPVAANAPDVQEENETGALELPIATEVTPDANDATSDDLPAAVFDASNWDECAWG